ncbi:DMT family transporter [Oceaniglobus trochenteri]|uniref:DMT family transporter n=1 Tax=Oceaniglobus trochenteri TaxID=2763260 RepID=UPI001CFFAC9F|nr:DMT family transporter [Oceaniglobus trochenteri]
MSDTLRAAITMLAAGIGIPVLATLNACLGSRIAAPAVAATALFAVALLCAACVAMVTAPGALPRLIGQPAHLFLGGVLIAFYVLSITWIAPRFGVGNAVFFVLLGQLISAGLIDHFGLFGARQQAVTLSRGAGIALMALGVALTQKG